ncbi:M64 family metallopeptidase [Alistipes sp.]|uniref:M64 family metallopeptidase n=1 Tax=Alistipes sp. TaxID=1872444 RepID=UPI000E83FF38|nr:M64 family metallopeptidase [Alistipes sp.]HBX91053.1 peptidase M64 [Alistipes sp.]HCN14412.1 peptidase M64 [Alistipes sp.]
MKKTGMMVLALLAWCGAAAQELSFGEFFHDKTMRFDYIHCGDSRSEHFYFDELREELHWAGSKRSLRDTTGYGSQFFRIVDAESGREIYSRGYCTLFDEWQSTVEALAVQRSYPESVVFPYPKRPCRIEIWSRDDKGRLVKRFEQAIDPESYEVVGFTPRLESFEVAYHGAPEHRVDIVLLPEGYSEGERAKFEEACREFAREFASYSPFREQFERFNIRAVWAPSVDSGVTIPGEGIWRNTACGANFYTFGSERYQTVADQQRLRDLAAHVPYDYIYVLSNTQKYGGGGIFNFYGISAAHHPGRTGKIYVHEFGHLLMGLGDEYVDPLTFEGMYPKNVEPWEPNLTTLTDFKRKEWAKMIDPSTPVPTPDTDQYENVVGVFEGGGYIAKGIWRPWRNCMMNNLHRADGFCPVCTRAIEEYIDFLCR